MQRRHFILGTAGHIDHGKTSLVRALTGIDTDRLPEEKRRGMTIELGFAELWIGDTHFGIVDVPGHERFVRTMVAGAAGIDLALIVVAADDAVMPQTVEHVEILNLLNVRRAVVAVTKTDVIDREMVELVAEEVRELLGGSPFADSPICPVSSVTGVGLEELRQAILHQSEDLHPPPAELPFHLSVDRVFTVAGRGTVVTGSALRGHVSTGNELEVWPTGEVCRVRDLQTHGEHQSGLGRGQRVAMNISGVDRDQLDRGFVLATPGFLVPSHVIGVRITALAGRTPTAPASTVARPIKSASTVRLCIGTTDLPARVVLLDRRMLDPGQTAYAQLRSGDVITAAYGQRFILRDETASRTIGGGVVLQPVVPRKRHDRRAELNILSRLDKGSAAQRVKEVLCAARFTRPTDLRLCAQAGVEPTDCAAILAELAAAGEWTPIPDTDVRVVPQVLEDLESRIVRRLRRYHADHQELPGRHTDAALGWLERLAGKPLAKPLFDRLIEKGAIKIVGQFVCLPEFAPALSAGDEKLLAAMIREMNAGGFQPPTLDVLRCGTDVDKKRLERLATLGVAGGQLVKIDGSMYLHADVERELRAAVAGAIAERGSVTVAEVRERVGTSRKYAVPFMEYLDRVGFTKRIEDRRVLAKER